MWEKRGYTPPAAKKYARAAAEESNTLGGILARAKRLEINARNDEEARLIEMSTHKQAIQARVAPTLPVSGTEADYSALETGIEAILDALDKCDGRPAAAAAMVREDVMVRGVAHTLLGSVRIGANEVARLVDHPKVVAYLRDRMTCAVVVAQRRAMDQVAQAGAEIMIRDVATRHAVSLRKLLEQHKPHGGDDLQRHIEDALSRALTGEDNDAGDDGWQAGQEPGDDGEGLEVHDGGGSPEEGRGEADAVGHGHGWWEEHPGVRDEAPGEGQPGGGDRPRR